MKYVFKKGKKETEIELLDHEFLLITAIDNLTIAINQARIQNG